MEMTDMIIPNIVGVDINVNEKVNKTPWFCKDGDESRSVPRISGI